MLQRNIISSQSQVPWYVQSPFLAAIQVPKCRETSPWGSQRQGLGAWCWFCYSEYFQSWVKTPAKGAGGLPQAVPNLAYQQQRNWSTKLLRVKWSTVAGSRRWSVPVSLRHRVHFCSVLLVFFFTFLLLSLCLWFHLQEELLPFIYCSSLFAAPGQSGPAPTTYQSQQEWFCQIETWQGEVWLLIYTCNKVFCSPWAEPRSSFRTQLHYNWFITTHPTASPTIRLSRVDEETKWMCCDGHSRAASPAVLASNFGRREESVMKSELFSLGIWAIKWMKEFLCPFWLLDQALV